jgi:sRNA-binding regulator protein Hfq
MANSSQIPATGLSSLRSERLTSSTAKLAPVSPAPSPVEHDSTTLPVTGPRKLVRPVLPPRSFRNRAFRMREEPTILAHQGMSSAATPQESTHAEAFYFQKQVQTQTPMVIVLEDGEQIEGRIEWYDRNAIKITGSTRMLVYKSGIKYIYKAGERRG